MKGSLSIMGFILFGILSQAVMSMPLPDKDNVLKRYHKGYNLKINRFFIVKKTPIQVFRNANDSNPIPQKVRLGQLFFASQEAGSRLLLGQYQLIGNNPGWSEMLGWVDKKDLLEDRIDPLTVGEAIKKGLNVKQSNEAGGLSPQNSLYLRTVTQPERLVKPRKNPDDETGTGKPINSFTWYYIYDVVKHQGKSWVLAGNTHRLASDDLFENTVGVAGPEKVLLGWLPLEKMTIWASNLALELNTSPESVHYRVTNNKPATVKAEPEKGSKDMYVEPLKILWPNGQENPDYQDSVRLDPYGLSPDFPRRVVVQAWLRWIEVASAASIKKDGIKESTILEIKRGLRKAMRDLQKVDLTFVVDATGSMADEIHTVSDFLTTLSQKLGTLQENGTPVELPFPNGDSLTLSTNLNIVVSLVSFMDIQPYAILLNTYVTKSHFKQLNVVKQINQIRAGLSSLAKDLYGGQEALHYGLKEGLDRKHWRTDTLDRIIVLISDEEGETNDEKGVLALMPSYSDHQKKLVSTLGNLSVSEQKKELTRIYSIFTGPDSEWAGFRGRVSQVSVDVTHIPNLTDQTEKDELIKLLLTRLREKQKEIKQRIYAIQNGLSKKKNASGQAFDLSALPGLSQLAIKQALERANLTWEKLQKLTDVAYYQGYVSLNEIEFDRLDANQTGNKEHPKSYRLRVMLRVGELTDLRDITKKVAGGLKTALTTLGIDDDPFADFLGSAEPKAKKLLICEIVLLVRDHVTGENRYVGQSGQKKLKQAAEKLLSGIQSGKLAGTSLGRVLLIPDSLPFRVDSFMSMSLTEVLKQEKPWFITQVDKLNLKATGLDRILNNGVVPEDFNAIGTAPANIGKRWRFSNSLTSTISYIYVPIGYIP